MHHQPATRLQKCCHEEIKIKFKLVRRRDGTFNTIDRYLRKTTRQPSLLTTCLWNVTVHFREYPCTYQHTYIYIYIYTYIYTFFCVWIELIEHPKRRSFSASNEMEVEAYTYIYIPRSTYLLTYLLTDLSVCIMLFNPI